MGEAQPVVAEATGTITVLWRVLAVQRKISQIPLGFRGDGVTGSSVSYRFQSLVV